MTVEITELSWYSKLYNYLKNRNRIEPEKVKLPDCDFFIVGPRRVLRILRPVQKSSEFYDLSADKFESINENFISKWIEKPHSSNNCRCSFRRSFGLNNTKKNIFSTEINHIKANFQEHEIRGPSVNESENKDIVNVNCLEKPMSSEPTSKKEIGKITKKSYLESHQNDIPTVRCEIVKDLEEYIDIILKDVLEHTMKGMSSADQTVSSKKYLNNENKYIRTISGDTRTNDKSIISPLDIRFEFPIDKYNSGYCVTNIDKSELNSYVNQAFISSANDPHKFDFDLRKPFNDKDLDIIDCTDSGVNSVETMELSIESDFSLEKSIMHIIEDKFSQAQMLSNLDDKNTTSLTKEDKKNTDTIKHGQQVVASQNENKNDISVGKEIVECKINSIVEIDEKLYSDLTSLVAENKIDQMRSVVDNNYFEVPLRENPIEKVSSIALLYEKVTAKLGNTSKNSDNKKKSKVLNDGSKKKLKLKIIEMENYKTIHRGSKEAAESHKESMTASDIIQRIRKPIIVFLHGFGSSAEIFKNQLQFFSNMGYPCIAPDMLGHGMSSTPDKMRDYHFEKLLNDLEEILHHYVFKPGQKCILVAHNYGCSFATALASKYTHQIHQLVLISGGGPIPLVSPTKEGAGHCCLRIILSPLLMCGLRRNILYAARGRQHPYCGSEQKKQWPPHMKYILNGMSWPEGDYLFHRRICIPTLLIHGLKDNNVSLVQECQMERTILKAYLEAIPMAGHIPMIDTPEEINHMINCFINLWSKKRKE
ncbi:uncharacterized protein LOC130664426 isoform X1 [Microplitis mediator]|uniref:uncharacterized protein LOC130664426 isoform X1 n=1 Tax=Microplitis mediator TaxID=375433 RepID=UPI002555FE66|nr:uncharacterized protein LOC130664426 isoform X1 [Microplitis mediator]